jgi:hypothetical protein
MGQEFFINNQTLENKVRELLPSQGGAGAGFDLSASTQIIPIIDLTESAEGSNVRSDLQTSFSLTNSTNTRITNATTNLVVNTGYYRIFGTYTVTGGSNGRFEITDGVTIKTIFIVEGSTSNLGYIPFDFNIFLTAGDTFRAVSGATTIIMNVTTRQIATIDGTLVNP